jgi:DNA primase
VAQFAADTKERVRAANDIVEVIGGYMPLRRAGTNFVALCPFHTEKTPSFNVSPARQMFHCFGCNTGGDVFKFVQLYEKLTFPEAIRRLADRAHIVIEETSDASTEDRGRREALFRLHDALCTRWQQCLRSESAGETAREYLKKRGVPEAAVEEFRIGAAPMAWDDTVNWAKTRGFDTALCEQAGLIIAREGGGHYDRFRGRLMFPICDEQGRVIAFSGRILADDEKAPKYVNSPETPLFTKGRVLFAMAGVRHAVAPQGTALTADHARVLRRYTSEVVLCFDGDNAGANAAIKALEPLLGANIAIRVATIPRPDDPDSFIKSRGAEAFKAILDRAEEFFVFYLRRLTELHDAATDRGRMEILQAYGRAALKTCNQVTIESCAQKLAQRFGVKPDSVVSEFRKLTSKGDSQRAPVNGSALKAEVQSRPERELWLLKLLILHPRLSARTAVQLEPEWVTNTKIREIIGLWLTGSGNLQDLLAQLEHDPEAHALVTEAATERRETPNPERVVSESILFLRNASLERGIAALGAKLADPTLPPEDRIQAMQEQIALRNLRRQPLPEPPSDIPAET